MILSREKILVWTLMLVALMSFTFLRELLIVLYPLLAFVLGYILKLKYRATTLLFAALFLLVGLLSAALAGGYYLNYALSAYLIVPVFLLLTGSVPKWESPVSEPYFPRFMQMVIAVLVIVNISAIIYSQLIIDPGVMNYDDAFTGFYGQAGLGSHTLSVVNLGVSVYCLSRRKYWSFTFFLICGVFGFYGLGLMVFVASLLLLYATRILRYWKMLLVMVLSAGVVLALINSFNARNLEYIKTNIERALLVFDSYDYEEELSRASRMEITQTPRFITFLDGSVKRLTTDPRVFWMGASPGGYNSRVAFYLNGDFIQNQWVREHVQLRTPYHEEDIFPLLNRELLAKPYNDGTRNQTFSSVVSVLLEYGFFLGGGYLLLFFGRIRRIRKQEPDAEKREFLTFMGYYTLILLGVQNYLEYPEIIFPIVIMFKLSEFDRRQEVQTSSHGD